MSVQVKWERKDDILIAVLIGHIDSSNADRFQRIVESGIDSEDHHALILDFERVFFISSAGLRISLVLSRKFNDSGKKFGICTALLHESYRRYGFGILFVCQLLFSIRYDSGLPR